MLCDRYAGHFFDSDYGLIVAKRLTLSIEVTHIAVQSVLQDDRARALGLVSSMLDLLSNVLACCKT
jgi:hypothetical protein